MCYVGVGVGGKVRHRLVEAREAWSMTMCVVHLCSCACVCAYMYLLYLYVYMYVYVSVCVCAHVYVDYISYVYAQMCMF